MQFKTLFTASLLSGLTVAAPEPKTFGLVALRSGSPFHLSSVSASESGFSLLLPKGKQGAKCADNKKEDFATFRISKDKKLVLYHKGKEQQIAYTDRSGMGQGVLQYTGQKNYPRNAETEGWKVDKDGNLVFGSNNAGFMACPGLKSTDPWSIWVATGTDHPGNSEKECYSFSARVAETKKPLDPDRPNPWALALRLRPDEFTLSSLWQRHHEACIIELSAHNTLIMRPIRPSRRQVSRESMLRLIPKAILSLYLCLDVYCMPEARDAGLGPLNETCVEQAHIVLPPFSIISNYTAEDKERIHRLERNETEPSLTFGEVVIPSETWFGIWWDTMDSVAYTYTHHDLYGRAMIYFWVVVVAIGVLNHLMQQIANSKTFRSHSSKSGGQLWSLYTSTVNRIAVPATFGDRCSQKVGWGTVPPRIQSLTLFAFLILNIVLSIHGYRIVPINMYFPSTAKQIFRYSSDRTGIISFANFPLIWLFGMRNNLLMWLTGWDFGTYNNFHRWVARIATLQAILHSIGYSILVYLEGGWEGYIFWWSYMFWWVGGVATVVMSLLVGASFYWIRRQQYELFLVVHIIMSILLLVTMLAHVSIFQGEYDVFFWVPCFIWVADRVLRALRIAAFNPKLWDTWATSIYHPTSNIVRLVIPYSSSLYKPAPGTFYYIHVLNGPRCWESHPFTVAAVTDEGQRGAKVLGEQVPLLESAASEQTSDADASQDMFSDSKIMTFLIRPYDGFTSRLRDTASAEWPKNVSQRVLVDGPYGHTQPLHTFDNVIFVVGGSGIVVPLSYLQLLTSGASSPRSVKIHWAVREPAFALDVLKTDIADALGSANLSVEIHLTTHTPQDELQEWPSQVTLRRGRIDAAAVVTRASDIVDGESLAVVACGPARMADDARRMVSDLLKRGVRGVEYFEESFQW
ncbi:hypothetical protein FGRA07_05080 [Fusarium graminearum]|nr:hypothetical protein FGRA07_05080 [Fusarium graminearum]